MPNLTKSSYDFHCGLESPLSFFRREWKSVAFFGGGFCLLMAAVVLWLDPAFFYPRLQTDPLFYYLKAKSLVETGSTSARIAVNVPPFAYAAIPGVLRAPLLLAFRDFDSQWRAIQLLNIPILASVALMSAYILSWTQPVRRHWMTVAFAFAFTALSPVWIANVFSPLADAPYAAFSLLAILVSIHVLCNDRPIRRMYAWVFLYCLLFVVTFLLRFTGPVLLVFAGTLALGRWQNRKLSPAVRVGLVVGPIVAVAVLVAFNAHAIFGRYFHEPLSFAVRGEKTGMLLNLFGLATPDQVIPDFHLGFSEPPVFDLFYAQFSHSARDAMWTGFGLAITAAVIYGLWSSRRRFLPEILYVLAPITVFAVMMPSTSRYLMSYQPFFWVFFYEGCAALARKYVPGGPIPRRSRAIAAVVAAGVIGLAGGLRWYRVVGTGTQRSNSVSMWEAPAYVAGVSHTFRSLRDFLQTLPKQNTLLIGSRAVTGRWTAIAERAYYMPDSALPVVAAQKEVYLVVECGTLEYCQSFPEWKNRMLDDLCNFGEFTYVSVFAVKSKWARAEVFRVTPAI